MLTVTVDWTPSLTKPFAEAVAEGAGPRAAAAVAALIGGKVAVQIGGAGQRRRVRGRLDVTPNFYQRAAVHGQRDHTHQQRKIQDCQRRDTAAAKKHGTRQRAPTH